MKSTKVIAILEENAQFGDDQLQSEQQMQEESHTESYTSFDSMSKSSSKVYNSVECNSEPVRKHQCAPISYHTWKDMPESYITNILELIQLLFPGESGVDQLVEIIKGFMVNSDLWKPWGASISTSPSFIPY